MDPDRVVLKVSIESHLRRVSSVELSDWTAFAAYVESVSSARLRGGHWVCSYQDEDGDMVMMSSNDEFQEALRLAQSQRSVLRLVVTEKQVRPESRAEVKEQRRVAVAPPLLTSEVKQDRTSFHVVVDGRDHGTWKLDATNYDALCRSFVAQARQEGLGAIDAKSLSTLKVQYRDEDNDLVVLDDDRTLADVLQEASDVVQLHFTLLSDSSAPARLVSLDDCRIWESLTKQDLEYCLVKLTQLGFTDTELNTKLLEQHKGKLKLVIEELEKKKKQQQQQQQQQQPSK